MPKLTFSPNFLFYSLFPPLISFPISKPFDSPHPESIYIVHQRLNIFFFFLPVCTSVCLYFFPPISFLNLCVPLLERGSTVFFFEEMVGWLNDYLMYGTFRANQTKTGGLIYRIFSI